MRLVRRAFRFVVATFLIFTTLCFVGFIQLDKYITKRNYMNLFQRTDYEFAIKENQYLVIQDGANRYYPVMEESDRVSFLGKPVGVILYQNEKFKMADPRKFEPGVTLIIFDVDMKHQTICINDNTYKLVPYTGEFSEALVLQSLVKKSKEAYGNPSVAFN